jgi:hypothetical protein
MKGIKPITLATLQTVLGRGAAGEAELSLTLSCLHVNIKLEGNSTWRGAAASAAILVANRPAALNEASVLACDL